MLSPKIHNFQIKIKQDFWSIFWYYNSLSNWEFVKSFGAMLCGLYYKHTTIVNYTSSVVNKLEALLTDDARVVIYDCHVFILKATDHIPCQLCQSGVIIINKDPTPWVRPPPISPIMSLTSSKFNELAPYDNFDPIFFD